MATSNAGPTGFAGSGRARRVALLLLTVAPVSCELEETSIVEVEDVVIGEVYVDLAADPADNVARAFLHRTVGQGDDGLPDELLDAEVTIRRPADGYGFALEAQGVTECLESSPTPLPGACFVADADVAPIAPGDLLEVTIDLVDGGRIEGVARLPGTFELVGLPETCRLPGDVLLPLAWSPAADAWAYLNETAIQDLGAPLQSEGIEDVDDPLYLLGLSISDTDTTIVFPSEFGVFNRFDLDPGLAVRLQRGLPAGAAAEVSITAVDRNYVNWARGGNFNPSGQVRVPSLRGDGTGVFGATVRRSFNVLVRDGPSGIPDCPLD